VIDAREKEPQPVGVFRAADLSKSHGKKDEDDAVGVNVCLENYGLFARISENLRGVRGVVVPRPE